MEAISEATNSRTLGELENYFSSYDDLPREMILKHDLLESSRWDVSGTWCPWEPSSAGNPRPARDVRQSTAACAKAAL